MEFPISQPQVVRLPRNEKQTYRLNSMPQIWRMGLTLTITLNFEFWRSNMEFPISQPKVVRLPRNEKQTYQLYSRPQMWPMGLTLTITLTFEFWRSNVTLTFDHTHDLDHGFSWSNFDIAVSQNGRANWHFMKGVAVGHPWPWPWLIWWPRSGVWIYQIVTGVTSVVGVPSTHLVDIWYLFLPSVLHFLNELSKSFMGIFFIYMYCNPFRKHLLSPESLPLYEIFYYNDAATMKRHINGAPRATIQTGLARPYSYIQVLVNSLAPGRCFSHFKSVISEHLLQIKFISTSYEIALRWCHLLWW